MIELDDYNEVRECVYKNEHYSVRDNGAVMRHQRIGMRRRKLDYVWSFGIPNPQSGYMEFCGERVHRIVATAFHGKAPSDQHVVDHIDTNRQNNRPENLQWLTRLENILNNEITKKKIIIICGSIDNFLANPSLLYGHESLDKHFSWMRNVSPEEAKNCLDNWTLWAKTADPQSKSNNNKSIVGEWVFDKPFLHKTQAKSTSDQVEVYSDGDVISDTCEITKVDTKEWLEETFTPKRERDNIDVFDLSYESLTLSARQSWYTPSEFPSCPPNIDNGLISYRDNLGIGAVLCSNRDFKLFVIDRAIIPDKDDMIVLCTNNDGENVWGAFSLISVEIVRDKYIHSIIRRFGNRERATRFYRLIIGEEEWTDDDLIMWDT